MIIKRQKLPAESDLVICTITKVFSHGAFAKLDEYEDKEGFIHVSEVASTWVKNIRDFVREGQKAVAKVLKVDQIKGHIDLSVRRVGDAQKKNKMQEWKRTQKAHKLLELAATDIKKDIKTAYQEVGFKLEDKYGEIYAGLEEIVIFGEDPLKELNVPEEWIKPITAKAKENVTIPYVNIRGYLDVTCQNQNGIEVIKEALIKARSEEVESDIKLDVRYVGSPRYRLNVTAPDYKTAEEVLKRCANTAISFIEKNDGTGKFLREVKEENV